MKGIDAEQMRSISSRGWLWRDKNTQNVYITRYIPIGELCHYTSAGEKITPKRHHRGNGNDDDGGGGVGNCCADNPFSVLSSMTSANGAWNVGEHTRYSDN